MIRKGTPYSMPECACRPIKAFLKVVALPSVSILNQPEKWALYEIRRIWYHWNQRKSLHCKICHFSGLLLPLPEQVVCIISRCKVNNTALPLLQHRNTPSSHFYRVSNTGVGGSKLEASITPPTWLLRLGVQLILSSPTMSTLTHES